MTAVQNSRWQWPMFFGALIAPILASAIYLVETRRPQASTFLSPTDGIAAFVNAARRHDLKKLEALLGPGSRDMIESDDPVCDKAALERFLDAFDRKSALVAVNDRLTSLHIGSDDWTLPFPLILEGGRWHFDLDAGHDEIVNRRVGRNESNVIEASLAFVDAERDYASVDRDGDGILEYAQRFMSTEGMRDGLYWPTQAGEPSSPLGLFFADAGAESYASRGVSNSENGAKQPQPSNAYYGYYYRILTSQGADAPGGTYDYIVNGNMIGGFAMIAYPAEYRVSGIMTFMVNHEGIVYQKDLGPDTTSVVEEITEFNPDDSWENTRS